MKKNKVEGMKEKLKGRDKCEENRMKEGQIERKQ